MWRSEGKEKGEEEAASDRWSDSFVDQERREEERRREEKRGGGGKRKGFLTVIFLLVLFIELRCVLAYPFALNFATELVGKRRLSRQEGLEVKRKTKRNRLSFIMILRLVRRAIAVPFLLIVGSD